jgi:hypothetical protein
MNSLKDGDNFQIQNNALNKNVHIRKKIKRVKSVNAIREKNWDDRFIYNKIPQYNSFKDKNVLINLRKKCHSSRKKLGITRGNPSNIIESSLYLYRPLSNKTTIGYPFINGKNSMKTISAKERHFIYNSNKKNDFNYKKFLLFGDNKILDNYKKYEILNNKDGFNNINIINLNNIIKLWNELSINNTYRNLFCVIYKELDDEDKEELYQRETNELLSIKNDIKDLKDNIELRLNTIKEISELNTKLNTEIINKDNKSNEIIINEISDKIGTLRQHTVNVCHSMKKLKYELNGLNNLDKYNINAIAEKFNFDKNYLIKMKGELNFLKEGFAKYYFNINNDHTPFLLRASEKSKISNDKDPFYHLIPLKQELKNEILECTYYIYQELIAYQNEKVNKRILRCISPLKRGLKINENESQYNNVKETNNQNFILNSNSHDSNNFLNSNNNILLKKSSSSIDTYKLRTKDEDKDKKDDKYNEYQENNNILVNDNSKEETINMKRNDKRFGSDLVDNKTSKNDYKNILMNYRINDSLKNQRKSDFNKKKNSLHIGKIHIKKEKNNNAYQENDKNNEEDKKDIINNLNKANQNKNEK